MIKRVLLLAVLVAVLVITPVAAADVVNEIEIFNETFEDYATSYITCYRAAATTTHSRYPGNSILVSENIANLADLSSIQIQGPAIFFSTGSGHDVGRWPITLTVGDNTIGYGEYYYFKFYVGDAPHYKAVIDLEEFNPPASVVSIRMSDPPEGYSYLTYSAYNIDRSASYAVSSATTDKPGYVVLIWDGKHSEIRMEVKVTVYEEHRWSNRLTVIDKIGPDNIRRNVIRANLIDNR